jgi:hypothetical protein
MRDADRSPTSSFAAGHPGSESENVVIDKNAQRHECTKFVFFDKFLAAFWRRPELFHEVIIESLKLCSLMDRLIIGVFDVRSDTVVYNDFFRGLLPGCRNNAEVLDSGNISRVRVGANPSVCENEK